MIYMNMNHHHGGPHMGHGGMHGFGMHGPAMHGMHHHGPHIHRPPMGPFFGPPIMHPHHHHHHYGCGGGCLGPLFFLIVCGVILSGLVA